MMINEIAAFFFNKRGEDMWVIMIRNEWNKLMNAIHCDYISSRQLYLIIVLSNVYRSFYFLDEFSISIHYLHSFYWLWSHERRYRPIDMWMCRRLIESYACNYNFIYNWQFFPDEQIHSTQETLLFMTKSIHRCMFYIAKMVVWAFQSSKMSKKTLLWAVKLNWRLNPFFL